ncbi:MAG: hypothetical protein AMS14_08895 [Planctomycetes bacterium DG_20]|nr:MAG: hypothetical protein AMS14_08895 [Planctomycetes bacterium DG_20]
MSERVQVGVHQTPQHRDALAMLRLRGAARLDLLRRADACRRAHFGDRVQLCSIVAARRGGCREDCAFCAQSAHYATGLKAEPTIAPETVLRAAREAEGYGVSHFGIVTSGRSLPERDFRAVLEAVELVARRTRLLVCASLGALSSARARALAAAGCRRYNHNLETSQRFFGRICTTHRYADRLATLRRARAAGLQLCCGGIIGVGETEEDRVALAFALRDLAPEVIPINVLVPIPGTPLAESPPLEPMEVLATVAMFRLVNPGAILKVAGGRERALRDLQSWMFLAGANALIAGNYLATAGRPAAEDLAMIRDLGLCVARLDGEKGRREPPWLKSLNRGWR